MTKPWIKTIRRASGLVEHICKHGVGHPAYGSVHWHKLHGRDGMDVHKCCGCCADKDWQIADLKEGVEIANALLYDAHEYVANVRKSIERAAEQINAMIESDQNNI